MRQSSHDTLAAQLSDLLGVPLEDAPGLLQEVRDGGGNPDVLIEKLKDFIQAEGVDTVSTLYEDQGSAFLIGLATPRATSRGRPGKKERPSLKASATEDVLFTDIESKPLFDRPEEAGAQRGLLASLRNELLETYLNSDNAPVDASKRAAGQKLIRHFLDYKSGAGSIESVKSAFEDVKADTATGRQTAIALMKDVHHALYDALKITPRKFQQPGQAA